MTKLLIKDIEKKLNKIITKNIISVGIDCAERFTGLCVLRTDDKTIYIESLQLIETSAKDDHFHRADHYIAALEKFKQSIVNYKEKKILIVERCFFGQNCETLIHLAHSGILAYATLRKEFDTYYYWGASTARSIIGFNQRKQEALGNIKGHVISKGKNKGKVKKIDCKSLVHDYLKTDFNLTFESKDCADGFVLSLAGLLK